MARRKSKDDKKKRKPDNDQDNAQKQSSSAAAKKTKVSDTRIKSKTSTDVSKSVSNEDANTDEKDNDAVSPSVLDNADDMPNAPAEGKKKKMKQSKSLLSLNDSTILKNYFRKDFFRSMKFVTDALLAQQPQIIEKCYARINQTQESNPELYQPIVKLMKKNLASKRGYVTEMVKNALQGMYPMKKMNSTGVL